MTGWRRGLWGHSLPFIFLSLSFPSPLLSPLLSIPSLSLPLRLLPNTAIGGKFSALLPSKHCIWWEQIGRFLVIFGSTFSQMNKAKVTSALFFHLEGSKHCIWWEQIGRFLVIFGSIFSQMNKAKVTSALFFDLEGCTIHDIWEANLCV